MGKESGWTGGVRIQEMVPAPRNGAGLIWLTVQVVLDNGGNGRTQKENDC